MTKLSKQAALIYVKGVGQFTQQQIHDYLLNCVKEFPTNYKELIADTESVYALLFKNGVFRDNLEAIKTYCPPSLEEQETIGSQDNDLNHSALDWFNGLDRIIEMNWYSLAYHVIYNGSDFQEALEQFLSDNADEINHYQAEAYADESADRKRKDC